MVSAFIPNCKNWFHWFNIASCAGKWSCWRYVFSLFPWAWLSQKEHFLSNSVSQHCSSLFGIRLEIWCESSCSWLMLCCIWFFPTLCKHSWLLICYSKVAQSYGVIIVWVICSGAPPRLSMRSLCQRLPGIGMDRNIKQEGRNRHMRAAAVHWRHTEPSQVHELQIHNYGSITQSCLVSGLQAHLSRFCLQVYLHPALDVGPVWYLHHLKIKVREMYSVSVRFYRLWWHLKVC